MMKKKFKWVVCPKPTGPYRSFQSRSWPDYIGINEQGEEFCLATILCADVDYSFAESKREDLDLYLRIYSYEEGSQFRKSFKSKAHFKTLSEAKSYLENRLKETPHFLPESLR